MSEEQFEIAVKVLHGFMRLMEKIEYGEDKWEGDWW